MNISRLTLTVLLTGFGTLGSAADRPTDSYQVGGGLEQPAEILIDEWGVPHIYANTHYDAFFVQGFNAARDRLWQIDSWRRRGLGQLSEVLGPAYAAQDRAARLFLYRGDMYREWLAYGSDSKRIAEVIRGGHQRVRRSNRSTTGTAFSRIRSTRLQAMRTGRRPM